MQRFYWLFTDVSWQFLSRIFKCQAFLEEADCWAFEMTDWLSWNFGEYLPTYAT